MEPGRLGNELQIAFVFFYFCFFVIGAVVPFTLAVEPGMLGNDLQISKPTALIAYRKPHNLETFVNYPTLMCFSCWLLEHLMKKAHRKTYYWIRRLTDLHVAWEVCVVSPTHSCQDSEDLQVMFPTKLQFCKQSSCLATHNLCLLPSNQQSLYLLPTSCCSCRSSAKTAVHFILRILALANTWNLCGQQKRL